jgi:hypothetical protein
MSLNQDDRFLVSRHSGTIAEVAGSPTSRFCRNQRSRPAICASGGSVTRDVICQRSSALLPRRGACYQIQRGKNNETHSYTKPPRCCAHSQASLNDDARPDATEHEDHDEDPRSEVKIMTTTEEIIVSGENFIERRIMQFPQQVDIEDLQARAYGRGYKRGWMLGFLMGLATIGFAAVCIWLALSIG